MIKTNKKLIFSLSLLLYLFNSCNSQENTDQTKTNKGGKMELINREPYAAGRFYSGSPEQLEADEKALFKNALPKQNNNEVAAIICPHAGYVFSGQVAATSLNQIDPETKYANIFIIGSSHTASFKGASVYNRGNYSTPLGEVKVNIELANELISESGQFVS